MSAAVLSTQVRAYKAGGAVRLHAYVLVDKRAGGNLGDAESGGGGGPPSPGRYVAVTKAFQLCFHSSDARGDETRAWPPRVTQLYDSIFLSRSHVLAALGAHVPQHAQKWSSRQGHMAVLAWP